jgi:hypothetical protein
MLKSPEPETADKPVMGGLKATSLFILGSLAGFGVAIAVVGALLPASTIQIQPRLCPALAAGPALRAIYLPLV